MVNLEFAECIWQSDLRWPPCAVDNFFLLAKNSDSRNASDLIALLDEAAIAEKKPPPSQSLSASSVL